MILFHRIFSKEIESSHRWSFWKTLGLSKENLVVSEELPAQTLRLLHFQAGKVQAVLNPTKVQGFPTVRIRHLVPLPEKQTKNDGSLTACVLPFPWSAILAPPSLTGISLELSDVSLRNPLEKLRESFERLESALSQTEIARLQFGSNGSGDAFMFHCVRGKIIRASFLSQFVPDAHLSELSQTSYSISAIPTHNPLNLQGFELALWQLQSALENKKAFPRVLPPSQSLLDTPLEL